MFFFFFSSRRRHTRLVSDWSSDVCSSDLDLGRVVRVSRMVSEIAKRPVSANKPIVGTHLFEVESGIVVHVITQMRDSQLGEIGFAPYLPELVGQEPITIVAGRGTGRHSVGALLAQLGLN